MVVSILPSSSDFHAVRYNMNKVEKGVAFLLEMKGCGHLQFNDSPTAGQIADYFKLYSSRNSRISKAQFHVAFSCKGHDMSEIEILNFAHRWLDKMGYGQEGQPMMAFAHRDTNNTHIHIITSRIDPDGRKIDHSHEKRRSKKVIKEILGIDTDREVADALEKAREYKCSTFSQFRAVLNTMGYDAAIKDEEIQIYKDGITQHTMPADELQLFEQHRLHTNQEIRRLRAIMSKYRNYSSSREELQQHLKTKFGYELVFVGSKDSPYGYFLIDHNEKKVVNGSRIMSVKTLLSFQSEEEKIRGLNAYIDHLLDGNPYMSSAQINRKLRMSNARISNYRLHWKDREIVMSPTVEKALRRNNKLAWAEKFCPQTKEEADVLKKSLGLPPHCPVHISDTPAIGKQPDIVTIRQIFNTGGPNMRATLERNGFRLAEADSGSIYFINVESQTIIPAKEAGVNPTGLMYPQGRGRSARERLGTGGRSQSNASQGHGSNREWEIRHGNDDDDYGLRQR